MAGITQKSCVALFPFACKHRRMGETKTIQTKPLQRCYCDEAISLQLATAK